MASITSIGRSDEQAMLDPTLLRTFLLVAQGHSFSETGRRLQLRQSTVSDHIRRLEASLGQRVFVRDTHSVRLTREGEALIPFAHEILDADERARRHFSGTTLRGRLRLGATEDLVVSWLGPVLQHFLDRHPHVDLELTIALSRPLVDALDAGDLDVVLCKRWSGEDRGDPIWRDEIAWVGAGTTRPAVDEPLPLVLYPAPSITRTMVLDALGRAGVAWRVACTCDRLGGIVAAAGAGVGVAVLARKLIPSGLVDLTDALALPRLGALEFILIRAPRTPRGAQVPEFCDAVMNWTSRQDAPSPRARIATVAEAGSRRRR